MSRKSPSTAERIARVYRGIEGLYILNNRGNLGYFSADGRRLIEESFDDGVLNLDGTQVAETTAGFLSELRVASTNFPPGEDKELGYLLAVDERTIWRTATLVLHGHVARALKDALDRDIKEGRINLMQGDRKARDLVPERGLHRGVEDLVNHIGAFGTHIYFPVLYLHSSGDSAALGQSNPLRVLNLLTLINGADRYSKVLAQMRLKLQERGVLNAAARVEHRFTLQN